MKWPGIYPRGRGKRGFRGKNGENFSGGTRVPEGGTHGGGGQFGVPNGAPRGEKISAGGGKKNCFKKRAWGLKNCVAAGKNLYRGEKNFGGCGTKKRGPAVFTGTEKNIGGGGGNTQHIII